jgi:beta-glucosidase
VRAPLVDVGRDPRWGRTEESLGEDPYLVAELAKGYMAGLHGSDPKYLLAASTLKHWLANNNEAGKNNTSATLDDRNLREYYGYPFQEAIQKGRAQGIMTAYNKVNNVPSVVSPLLKSLVINQRGFDGFICTDAWTVQALVDSQAYYPNIPAAIAGVIKAGTGVILQEGIEPMVSSTYNAGMFTQAEVDAVLRPLLRVRFRLGDLDPASYVPHKSIRGTETPWNTAEYKQRALEVTRKSVVLLKNASNALPLDRAALPNGVAIIGPRADAVLRDWYGGLAPYKVTARQGITTKLGTGVTIRYAADGSAAVTAAQQSSVAIVFVGNHPTCGPAPPEPNTAPWAVCPTTYEGREAVDRVNIAIEPSQLTLVQNVRNANPRTIVVLVSSFPQPTPWLEQNVPAIVHITNSGQELGTAIADVLFGDYNPAGRTTMTWYSSESQIPTAMTDYDIRKGTTYLYYTGTPLYPFGHGLSYTSFAYSNLHVSGPMVTLANCGRVTVSVDVRNTGTRSGDEVVQLYVAYPTSASVPRPRQQLRGFKRVSLAAGAMQRVSFELPGSALTYWDAAGSRAAVQTGTIEIQVGASSKDIRLRQTINVAP